MPKIETVITALAICTGKCKCFGCWCGRNNHDFRCQDRLKEDALVLLREQEAAKPKVEVDTWVCGNCGTPLERQSMVGENAVLAEQFDYCPHCGRKVKWE